MVRSLLTSFFLPTRGRASSGGENPATSSWVSKKITPLLHGLSRRACLHPIHTIVIVAVLASTTYIGLLESSLFDSVTSSTVGKADWASLLEGSRQLRVGSETGWKWQPSDTENKILQDADHIALLTFVFPDSLAADSPQTPLTNTIALPQNLSVTELPSTSNPLSAISQDTALAYAVPYSEAPEFLARAQEFPNTATLPTDEKARHGFEAEPVKEQKKWIMKAAKVTARGGVKAWVANA